MTKHDEAARRILDQHGAPANDPHGAALVHATLYLAEQQRLANLIALYGVPEPDAADLATSGVSWPEVKVEIIEGLGLV